MPVSVKAEVGRQSIVKLKQAVLLYGDDSYDGDTFATLHDVTGVESSTPELAPGRLLSVEGLRHIHKNLYRLQKLELLPPHILAVNPERLVWFEPARNRVMFFKTADAYLQGLSGIPFPHPTLLFIAGERSLKVFALRSNERPTAETEVYTAPYYNTSSGGVCLGSTPLPATLSVNDTESYSDAFFHSAFTHGTSERLLKGWGGSYGEFWTSAEEREVFPLVHLVPLASRVAEVINS